MMQGCGEINTYGRTGSTKLRYRLGVQAAVAIGRRLHVQISKRTPQDKYTEGSVQGVVEEGDQEFPQTDVCCWVTRAADYPLA
jgi:hypothetical protein